MDGDGDITRPENVTAFRNFVMENTERRGLHFLMADGVRFLKSMTVFFLKDPKALNRLILVQPVPLLGFLCGGSREPAGGSL